MDRRAMGLGNKLEISEIFNAPQGEGPNMGRQSLFVRVHRCPLACAWCDTRYTWDKSDPDYDKFESLSPQELVWHMKSVSREMSEWPPMAVVFTGGEPMIYQRQIVEVVYGYRRATQSRLDASIHAIPFEVETSGVIAPTSDMLMLCHFNVSQKLPSSGNENVPLDKLLNVEATKRFAGIPGNTFKVVVAEADGEIAVPSYLSWLKEATEEVVSWRSLRERVYLMPEGTTAERVAERQAAVIDLAQQYGVCATTRMQVIAHDNERGR